MANYKCPCCNAPMSGVVPLEDVPRLAKLGKLHKKVYNELVKYMKSGRSRDQLIHILYSDRNDGGPLNANMRVSVYLSQIRRKIEPLGWTISGSVNNNDHDPIWARQKYIVKFEGKKKT